MISEAVFHSTQRALFSAPTAADILVATPAVALHRHVTRHARRTATPIQSQAQLGRVSSNLSLLFFLLQLSCINIL